MSMDWVSIDVVNPNVVYKGCEVKTNLKTVYKAFFNYTLNSFDFLDEGDWVLYHNSNELITHWREIKE